MQHEPVLLNEVLRYIAPKPGMVVVDGTFGLGGHARELGRRLKGEGRIIGIERDKRTLKYVREKGIEAAVGPVLTLVHGNFAELPAILERLGIPPIDAILLDLGVSSWQLGAPDYGLSWQAEGPLDMRLDDEGVPARTLVERLTEKELADLLYQNAEEYRSRAIARAIKKHLGEIKTTADLAQVVAKAVPRRGRLHPATKTFMALRMAANKELENLAQFLAAAAACLKPQGRLVVISFHSGEDRLVKNTFRSSEWQALTKKPVTPGREERSLNPRSRSAKLRAAAISKMDNH